MKKITALLAVLGAFICQVSFAQSTSGSADTTTMNFITNATVANMKEVATGKLAGKKAKDPSVKRYGDQMVEHHTMATKEMMAIVKKKNYTVPKPPAPPMSGPDTMLASASGAEFDRMYITMMIADHKSTIQLFETASANVPDPDLKAFATKTLPLLRQHLAMVQSIASQLNINTQ